MRILANLVLMVSCSAALFPQSNTIQLRNGANTTTLIAPAGGNYTLTLPASAGSTGQALTTNGSGTLSWSAIATSIDGLSDAKSGGTNFTGSLMLGQEPASLGVNALQNTAVGIGALSSLTTGDNNVAVGYNALSSGATSEEVVAIGYNALAAGSGAGRVVAVGPEAASSCASCNYSVFIGRRAGAATNVVSDNTVVGNDAFRMNTSGSDNTVIGANAMENQTSGNFNTAVGRWAGVSNTTGSGSVFLGYNAGPTAAAAVNNSLYIHNASSNTPLIKGDFAATTLTFNGSTTTTGTSALNGNVTVGGGASATEVRFLEPSGSGSEYVALKAPDAIPSNVTFKLPIADGARNGVVLITNGSGQLSFSSVTGVQVRRNYRDDVTGGTHSVADADAWIAVDRGASTTTITLPDPASYQYRELMIKAIEHQTVVSASANVVPVTGGAAGTAILPAVDGAWATLVSNGTNWIVTQRSEKVAVYTATAATNAATIDANVYSSASITGDGAGTADVITINNGYEGQTITIFYDATAGVDQPQVNGKDWGTAGFDVGLTCTKLGGTWRVVGVAAY